MIHLEQLKLRELIKPLAGLAASTMVIGNALAFDPQSSLADIQVLTVAYAPMQPVIQTEPALPNHAPTRRLLMICNLLT